MTYHSQPLESTPAQGQSGPAPGPISWSTLVPLTDEELEAPLCASGPATPTSPIADPIRLGPYEVLEEVSRGGQATVYRARHPSGGPCVAIKLMHGGNLLGTSPDGRFVRERRFLASMDHPNIVRLRDHGIDEEGRSFLVMDFVDGPTLETYFAPWRDRGDYLQEVLRIFATLARALDTAHRAGIVHRDLKPANIRVDGVGEPQILDFGLASPYGMAQWSSLPTLTGTGQVVGSLPWSSPEQVSGGQRPVDHRTDLYALGVMLYQELSGRFPYEVRGTLQHVINQITQAKPAPLVLRASSPGAHQILAPLVMRMLSKSPAKRYPTGQAVAKHLEQVRQQVCRPPKRARGARRWGLAVGALAASLGAMVLPAAHEVAPAMPENPTVARFTNSLGIEFVRMPPGTFVRLLPTAMGSPSPGAVSHVALSRPYYIATRKVTVEEYLRVTGKQCGSWQLAHRGTPAYGLSWSEAQAFCRRLAQLEGRHYRLPTEAEWEYAFKTYGAGVAAGDEASADTARHAAPEPAGGRAPGQGGLDLHDEIGEWCEDVYGPYPPGDSVDPTGPASGRMHVVRGGRVPIMAGQSPLMARGQAPTEGRDLSIGIRLVVECPEALRPASGVP